MCLSQTYDKFKTFLENSKNILNLTGNFNQLFTAKLGGFNARPFSRLTDYKSTTRMSTAEPHTIFIGSQ